MTASQKELQELLDHVHKKFDPGWVLEAAAGAACLDMPPIKLLLLRF